MINKHCLFFLTLYGLIFTQSIYHDPIKEALSGTPIEINILAEIDDSMISKFELFFRTENQTSFFRQNILKRDIGNYYSIIPAQFIQGEYLEYYIVYETLNNLYISPNNSLLSFALSIL